MRLGGGHSRLLQYLPDTPIGQIELCDQLMDRRAAAKGADDPAITVPQNLFHARRDVKRLPAKVIAQSAGLVRPDHFSQCSE